MTSKSYSDLSVATNKPTLDEPTTLRARLLSTPGWARKKGGGQVVGSERILGRRRGISLDDVLYFFINRNK